MGLQVDGEEQLVYLLRMMVAVVHTHVVVADSTHTLHITQGALLVSAMWLHLPSMPPTPTLVMHPLQVLRSPVSVYVAITLHPRCHSRRIVHLSRGPSVGGMGASFGAGMP